jgi:3-methyladenine DNA glycosylase AlkD
MRTNVMTGNTDGRPTKKTTKARKPPAGRMPLKEAMRALEKAGSAQTRRTYARHGASEPMFGVSFAVLKTLTKRIGVDHDLALALWDTGNFDARNLAFKVADPARMSSSDLDRWARDYQVATCATYVAALAAEGPHAAAKASRWLDSKRGSERCAAWALVGQMASRDESTPGSWFAARLAEIERTIHAAPNFERYAMNGAIIAIGGRSAALRKSALAVARRIGTVEVDHGDTACKTPEAGPSIERMWAHADAKGFASPAAQERARKPPRIRC